MKKVSIIVPVYNSEKTIKRCVQSVLNQTYTQYELILVDDGSTDLSGKLCEELAEKKNNIIVIHQKNGGVSVARNTGIDVASGEYILFLDSDDYLKSDMLETYVMEAKKKESDVIIGALELSDQSGKILARKTPVQKGCFGKEIWDQICRNSEVYGYAGGKMIAAKILQDTHIHFNPNLASQEDLAFCLEVYQAAERISTLDYSGYCYEYVPGQRIPQYKIYLQNQLCIIEWGRQAGTVTAEGEANIRSRIELLLYSFLYMASCDDRAYQKAVEDISEIEGLRAYLKEKINFSEKGLTGQAVRLNLYGGIKQYFHMRDRLKYRIKGSKR